MSTIASCQGSRVVKMFDQECSTNRVVTRTAGASLARGPTTMVSQLIRTDSIPPGVLLSPMRDPNIFQDYVDSEAETDSSVKACLTPIQQTCLLSSCAAQVDDSEHWCLSLSYSYTEDVIVTTPMRTFKDTSQRGKCRFLSASVPRRSERCNLSAT